MIGDYFGSMVLDVVPSAGSDEPVRAVSPRQQVVATAMPYGRELLGPEDEFRGEGGWHARRDYLRMMQTPAAGSSFNALRSTILSGKADLLPAVSASAATSLGQSGGDGQGDDLVGREADLAVEVCESNKRMIHSWDTPVDVVLHEMLEAMVLGHVVAERTFADVQGGPDDGLWAIDKIRPLPISAYRFRVDRAMNVVGFGALTFDAQGQTSWANLPVDHFTWLTWDPYRGDPRGRSCFRMAHYAWKCLMGLWPEIIKGWKQFGTPMLHGALADGAKMVPALDKLGREIPGEPAVDPRFDMARAMLNLQNGAQLVTDFGAVIKVIESSKDATVVSGALDILKNEIVSSILLQTRATVEAKHGSRADSETGQDIMGTLVRFCRKWLERWLRSNLMAQNTLNYGPEIARRCTPLVDLGSTEHQDFAGNATAVAGLVAAKFLQPSQLPAVNTMLGLPVPTKGEITALTATLVQAAASPADPGAVPDPTKPQAAPPAQGVAA